MAPSRKSEPVSASGHREGLAGPAEGHPHQVGDHDREAVGHQHAREVRVLGPVDALEHPALDEDADEADRQRRREQGEPEAPGELDGEPARVGAEHVEDPMGEVDDAHEPEHDGQPSATRIRMQPFTSPMNSCVYQISSGNPKSVRSGLAQGLLRIEAFALARLGGRLAAHACTMSKKSHASFIAAADLPLQR